MEPEAVDVPVGYDQHAPGTQVFADPAGLLPGAEAVSQLRFRQRHLPDHVPRQLPDGFSEQEKMHCTTRLSRFPVISKITVRIS